MSPSCIVQIFVALLSVAVIACDASCSGRNNMETVYDGNKILLDIIYDLHSTVSDYAVPTCRTLPSVLALAMRWQPLGS
jgi:hypothetical protein